MDALRYKNNCSQYGVRRNASRNAPVMVVAVVVVVLMVMISVMAAMVVVVERAIDRERAVILRRSRTRRYLCYIPMFCPQ